MTPTTPAANDQLAARYPLLFAMPSGKRRSAIFHHVELCHLLERVRDQLSAETRTAARFADVPAALVTDQTADVVRDYLHELCLVLDKQPRDVVQQELQGLLAVALHETAEAISND